MYRFRSGDRIPVGARFSAPVHTGPGALPTSGTMGTGSSPGVKSGRGETLTPHPLLVPWSWNSRATSLPPQWAVRPVQSLSACTRVTLLFYVWVYVTFAWRDVINTAIRSESVWNSQAAGQNRTAAICPVLWKDSMYMWTHFRSVMHIDLHCTWVPGNAYNECTCHVPTAAALPSCPLHSVDRRLLDPLETEV
jgi:hypothetical protein